MAAMATIVISRHPGDDAARQRFEEDLVAELRTAAVRVVVAPHVYYLKATDAAAARLKELVAGGAPVVVAGWLYPRALRWALAALGCPVTAERAMDLRTSTSPQECAARLAASVGAGPGSAGVEDLGPGGATRWYPVIDRQRCTGCKQCLDFCLFGVYSPGESDAVLVTQPDNCKPGCPACARVCPAGAIMFPEYGGSAAIAGSTEGGSEKPVGAKSPEVPSAASPAASSTAARKNDELDDLIDALDDLDQD